ncbi:MAG: hypothetical protein A2939_03275 [Parcubacteria group bacterium RIFCSPLOWO2_01_FULL_48_18]|nr:MAG: hypothetical protein A3J67_01830 [Parcubacteria group bacterium RIFCSPHIGHO2_02_FULL_48_10b]OHB23411.1 MAG: hypothetical protein A2939_03275 [Parcubacteria group bacterium RIFCSPLOWO2_01_FULL_48_18]
MPDETLKNLPEGLSQEKPEAELAYTKYELTRIEAGDVCFAQGDPVGAAIEFIGVYTTRKLKGESIDRALQLKLIEVGDALFDKGYPLPAQETYKAAGKTINSERVIESANIWIEDLLREAEKVSSEREAVRKSGAETPEIWQEYGNTADRIMDNLQSAISILKNAEANEDLKKLKERILWNKELENEFWLGRRIWSFISRTILL